MNLIENEWIPVRRRSGKVARIAPWQLTEGFAEDPFVRLAAPRPDFNGALVQFLIGLLQTAVPPPNGQVRRAWRRSPPSAEELRARLESLARFFDLDGSGARFLQESALAPEKKVSEHPITYLLIDAPTDNTILQNRDHFVKAPGKRGVDVEQIACCPACAATALYTMQTFAPQGGGGGGGKFTSLRGGGPLSTVLLGDTLWETVWLNVLEAREFEARKRAPEYSFPWLAPEKFIKAKKGRAVTSEEMAPIHVYWGMPRRVLLQVESSEFPKTCWICGAESPIYVRKFLDATLGISYYLGDGNNKKPSWIHPLHPLSPYDTTKDYPSAAHPPPGGITYRHWLGVIYADGDSRRQPATSVSRFLSHHDDLRLWAYGYEMVSMNARRWHESVMPILAAPDGLEETYGYHTSNVIRAAQHASGALVLALVRSAYGKAEVDPRGGIKWGVPKRLGAFRKSGIEDCDDIAARAENAWLEQARLSFWQATEPIFFTILGQLRGLLQEGIDAAACLRGWLRAIEDVATQIYDDLAEAGSVEVVDPRRVALARQEMRRALSGLSKRVGLP